MVKNAVKELQPVAEAQPVDQPPGLTNVQRRRLIDDTIGQLLALLSQKADHATLTQKVEVLYPGW